MSFASLLCPSFLRRTISKAFSLANFGTARPPPVFKVRSCERPLSSVEGSDGGRGSLWGSVGSVQSGKSVCNAGSSCARSPCVAGPHVTVRQVAPSSFRPIHHVLRAEGALRRQRALPHPRPLPQGQGRTRQAPRPRRARPEAQGTTSSPR